MMSNGLMNTWRTSLAKINCKQWPLWTRSVVYSGLGNSEVTEIFKTPGKLRGKTPRTARKRNPLEQRLVSPCMSDH